MTTRILVVQGPGADPGRRGLTTPAPGSPAALDDLLERWGRAACLEGRAVWAGDVDAMCAALEDAGHGADGLVLLAGDAAFTSAALADALSATRAPAVDLHLRDLGRAGRRPADSRLAAAGARVIHGRGVDGYRWALIHLRARIAHPPTLARHGNDPDHVGELRVPDAAEPPHRVAVLVHGGFWYAPWERDLMDALAVALAADGVATWNVEYRRVGSGGGWPAARDDVRAAVDALVPLAAEWWLDLDDVTLVGHSAGAQLALLAARRAASAIRIRRVIGLAGVLDLAAAHEQRLGGGAVAALLGDPPPPGVLEEASPAALVPAGLPTLLAHTVDDPLVPVAQSRAYAAAARAAGDDVDLLELEGDDHFALLDPRSPAWSAVAERLHGDVPPP